MRCYIMLRFWISTWILSYFCAFCFTCFQLSCQVRCFLCSNNLSTWCMWTWLWWLLNSFWWHPVPGPSQPDPMPKNWSVRSALILSMARCAPDCQQRDWRPIDFSMLSFSAKADWFALLSWAWSAFSSSIISIRPLLKVMIDKQRDDCTKANHFLSSPGYK